MITNFKIYEEQSNNFKKYLLIYKYDISKIKGICISLLTIKYIGKKYITTEELYDYGYNGGGENGVGLLYNPKNFRPTIKINYNELDKILYQDDNLDNAINKMIEIYKITSKSQKYNL